MAGSPARPRLVLLWTALYAAACHLRDLSRQTARSLAPVGDLMPQYRIVAEETVTTLSAKVFDAPTLDDAIAQAEADDWRTWDDFAEGMTQSELRTDLCVRVEP